MESPKLAWMSVCHQEGFVNVYFFNEAAFLTDFQIFFVFLMED